MLQLLLGLKSHKQKMPNSCVHCSLLSLPTRPLSETSAAALMYNSMFRSSKMPVDWLGYADLARIAHAMLHTKHSFVHIIRLQSAVKLDCRRPLPSCSTTFFQRRLSNCMISRSFRRIVERKRRTQAEQRQLLQHSSVCSSETHLIKTRNRRHSTPERNCWCHANCGNRPCVNQQCSILRSLLPWKHHYAYGNLCMKEFLK